MKFTYKTEIKPTTEQVNKIKQNIGTCCWVYNQYIKLNTRLYKMYQRGLLDKKQTRFISAGDFEDSITGQLKTKKDFFWINQCDGYARKIVLINAENAFKKFFQGKANFPRLKKYNGQDVKLHLKSRKNDNWVVQRHRINIPTLGFIKLKEFGYLPTDDKVVTGTVSNEAGRYYVSITVDKTESDKKMIKENALSDKKTYTEVLSNDKVIKIIKKIRREKRSLDRKYSAQNISVASANIRKQKEKISKLEQRLRFIQMDCLNKSVRFDKKEV